MNERQIFALCDQVRETAFALHRYLRHGLHEKIYERGLVHRLRKQGVTVDQQVPFKVYDEDGTLLGDFAADLIVEKELLLELKACPTITSEDVAQTLGYMRALRIEHGLLIGFGAPRLYVKKYILSRINDPYPED